MKTQKTNVFISYCHDDDAIVTKLADHLKLLERNHNMSVWFDKDVQPGHRLFAEIDEHLDDANIVVFCVSSGFLLSSACQSELTRIQKDEDERTLFSIPFILEPCPWEEDQSIAKVKVLPTDGRPVSVHSSPSTPFQELYDAIVKIMEDIDRINAISIDERFVSFLQDAGFVASVDKTQKRRITLDDLYVDPELKNDELSNQNTEDNVLSGSELPHVLVRGSHVVVSGPSQSGKTTLCKILYLRLFDKELFPVYLDGTSRHQGRLQKRVQDALETQYGIGVNIPPKRIVLILDDFHRAENKDVLLEAANEFRYSFMTVDDLFTLDVRNQNLLRLYHPYSILPFSPKQRSRLTEKWLALHPEQGLLSDNDGYARLDWANETVSAVLGKVLGRGVMPEFPFYILLILATLEASAPISGPVISSQGYCYQALLWFALRKNGVANNEIDTYVNFLTELARTMFSTESSESVNGDQLEQFVIEYNQRYNLPVERKRLFSVLDRAGILTKDRFGAVRFKYRYLFFYFISKYLAENENNCESVLMDVLSNLGQSRNAYIAVFLTHHARSESFLQKIVSVSEKCLADVSVPCYLTGEDLSLLDGHANEIVQASIDKSPGADVQNRERQLDSQAKIESSVQETDEAETEPIRELLRAIRTASVLGQIVKDRAGSIKRPQLQNMIRAVILLHAKMLAQFFGFLNMQDVRESTIELIASLLASSPRKNSSQPLYKLRERASWIFWNLNFITTNVIVTNCIRSIGSDQLWSVIDAECMSENRPLSVVVRYGVEMFYKKRVDFDNIGKTMKEMPLTVQKMIRTLIAAYCNTHKMSYDDRQRAECFLKGSRTLPMYLKHKED